MTIYKRIGNKRKKQKFNSLTRTVKITVKEIKRNRDEKQKY